eukprot:745370-Rhodomonas_salina.2
MVIPLRINVNLKSLTMDELKVLPYTCPTQCPVLTRCKLLRSGTCLAHAATICPVLTDVYAATRSAEAQRDLMEEVTRHHPDDPAATGAAYVLCPMPCAVCPMRCPVLDYG